MPTTTETPAVSEMKTLRVGHSPMKSGKKAIWEWKIVRRHCPGCIRQAGPSQDDGRLRHISVVEIGSVITTILLLRDGGAFKFNCRSHSGSGSPCCSPTSPRRWPKAVAKPKPTPCAKRVPRPLRTALQGRARRRCRAPVAHRRSRSRLRRGVDSRDGDVIEGVASVDESAITGESAPVIREAGGDRSAVTGGTRVLSDQIKVGSRPIPEKPSSTA